MPDSARIILRMGSVNEKLRYIVTPSFIGGAHNQIDPWARVLYSDLDLTYLRLKTGLAKSKT